jgi:uncharacterized protein YbjT (DUF2867 family)
MSPFAPKSGAVLITGGSLATGQLVASLARAQGRPCAVIDALERAGSLTSTVTGAEGVVIVSGRGVESVARLTHDVVEARRASAGQRPCLVLVSGFSVGHGLAHRLNTPERLQDRLMAERLVRHSGCPYVILRPTWLTNDPPGRYAVTFTQDPLIDGMVARADLAAVALAVISESPAWGKTFALYAEPSVAGQDWAAALTRLIADA